MQMIAKALVFNMLQGLMGGGGTSGAGGGLLGMLFGAGGMATGGMIAGIKRAALGEMIPGGTTP
ncbi:tail tape measure protein, partial [Mesorhizobium sp. M1D.F.Ca.ET.183.01.1.1]